MESLSAMQSSLARVSARRAAAAEVSTHIELTVTRAETLRPAREALAAAEVKKQLGNDGFRVGDFLVAYSEYMEAHKALDVAMLEPTTAYAAEKLRLTVLANTAQCALKTKQPEAAAKFCRDAISLSACVAEVVLFKKILVRLAQAHVSLGEVDKALAVVREGQLRGVHAAEFCEINKANGVADAGTLEHGVEMRMFIMLALRMSAGADNLERMREVLRSGKLPHVDRRDEVGNNVLWGVLQALTVEREEQQAMREIEGGARSVPTLALLLHAGADPHQRYDQGRTPLMYTAGSGLVAAVNAVLEAPGGVPSGFDEKKLNAADENGWTALHVACTAPQRGTDKKNADPQSRCDETDGECGHSHSHGGPDSTDGDAPGAGPDSAAVVALLLAKGADPRIQNAEGDGALSVAAIHGNVDAIAALLAPPTEASPHTGPELLRMRNHHGMSAYVAACKLGHSEAATDMLASARCAGGAVALEAEENARLVKFSNLVDAVASAHNDFLESHLQTKNGAALSKTEDAFITEETEATRLCAMLAESGFAVDEQVDKHDAPRLAFEKYGDVYSALHGRVMDVTPNAMHEIWHPNTKKPSSHECSTIYWCARGTSDEKNDEKKGGLVSWTEEGVVASKEKLAMLMHPTQHAFSFAVPCVAALDCIAQLKMGLVEMGAGTGYWAALLRERGVDIVAYDRAPPTAPDPTNGKTQNLFFNATFTDVLKGDESELAKHADRALFLCWPVAKVETKEMGMEGAVPWDARCLDTWQGDTLIHVGEWRVPPGEANERDDDPLAPPPTADAFPRGTAQCDDPGGITTSLEFQLAVETQFDLKHHVKLPNWPNTRDDLTVWVRK